MESVSVARNAMATRFEILLNGENSVALRAAAEEALDEIERLGSQLSLYQPASEIYFINHNAAAKPVKVEPRLFRLLQLSERVHRESGGVFDITVAPLMRCWGFMGANGAMPDPQTLEEARANVGMHQVELNEAERTVRFQREGVMLDLGSIGKGYALEQAAEILQEAGVTSALLHGGTSTVFAIGAPPEAEAWKVAIERPPSVSEETVGLSNLSETSRAQTPVAVISLRDEAMSVSGVHGKSFTLEGRRYGHVIDPRSGHPVQGALLAAVVLPSATETDAFSTALLTLGGGPGHSAVAALRPGMKTLVAIPGDASGEPRYESYGIELLQKRVAE